MADPYTNSKGLSYPLTKMNFLVKVANVEGTAAFSQVTGIDATVDVIEFTDLENSPKNLMLRARRNGRKSEKGRALAREIAGRYGFTQTLLELT